MNNDYFKEWARMKRIERLARERRDGLMILAFFILVALVCILAAGTCVKKINPETKNWESIYGD